MDATSEGFHFIFIAKASLYWIQSPVTLPMSFNHNFKWASSLRSTKQRHRLQEQRTYLSQQAQTVRRIFSAFLVVLIEFENNDNNNNKTHAPFSPTVPQALWVQIHSLWPSYWSVAHNATDQVAPPHCWHHLAYHSVPSGQSGACVPMSVSGRRYASLDIGFWDMYHKYMYRLWSAHGFWKHAEIKRPVGLKKIESPIIYCYIVIIFLKSFSLRASSWAPLYS
jgi:hypothetical protein